MSYRVLLPKSVQKELDRLSDENRKRVLARLGELETNPRPADVKKTGAGAPPLRDPGDARRAAQDGRSGETSSPAATPALPMQRLKRVRDVNRNGTRLRMVTHHFEDLPRCITHAGVLEAGQLAVSKPSSAPRAGISRG